jgi:hypothetical protein
MLQAELLRNDGITWCNLTPTWLVVMVNPEESTLLIIRGGLFLDGC